ncbi:hypothetical protein H1P_5020004 [Hyella patelloides LEGE 07179]|uniref:Uncharacterized protein n=1 Tax=Hyella patelloides LEGE 07179 TaxID=945734 RepID=A0A563VZI9_9CYAN|nr:hypothetical protein H1P_5020004 [Hyella patelloides LEGE 07179]
MQASDLNCVGFPRSRGLGNASRCVTVKKHSCDSSLGRETLLQDCRAIPQRVLTALPAITLLNSRRLRKGVVYNRVGSNTLFDWQSRLKLIAYSSEAPLLYIQR